VSGPVGCCPLVAYLAAQRVGDIGVPQAHRDHGRDDLGRLEEGRTASRNRMRVSSSTSAATGLPVITSHITTSRAVRALLSIA
jgi:hypothetical protein